MHDNQLLDEKMISTQAPVEVRTNRDRYRYTILGLLFLATCINYIDRQIIGLLKPILEEEFLWSETDYANIVFWFQVLYAAGYYVNGRLIDRVGARIGYGLSVLLWSIAAIAHAFVNTVFGFKIVRGALGFFEASNFPAAIKAISEWFPKEERGFATGVMISGTTIGAALAPGIVLWLAHTFGWQVSFWITGSLGLIWVIAWGLLYRKPKGTETTNYETTSFERLTAALPATGTTKTSVKILLKKKATWGLIWATFLTDHVWWFYLFWLPSYLAGKGLSKTQIAIPLTIVYLVTAMCSIAGGWVSSRLLKQGWSLNKTRKRIMFSCVIMVSAVGIIRVYDNIVITTALIALAAAAQAVWKSTLLTSVPDQFSNKVVSTVLGIAGLAGSVGGMIAIPSIGYILDYYKSANSLQTGYNLIFIGCSGLFIVAFGIFHLLSPNLKRSAH